ncbi:hypothetical protein KOR42_34160 [Thalassoglobus neptunius]|uniref:Uncharacterized protein n=1 Tax=Thalassoglobus neptunius TaxID=1938619 RepID=A0A5C5WNP9_9PLAN|nr:hypothetical protein [Thalassoglobus neptunius]TWT51729.1 hypothetical protein KOR42_34160 [Thalassoglobus neptunius]
MLHADRVWSVSEVSSAEELAKNLSEATWCCCQAFQITDHPRYVWLNDSTSEDGAQEYAVCRIGLTKGDILQIETITFGWCDYKKSLQFIRETLNGNDDDNEWARKVSATIETAEEHGRCGHCA